MTLTFLFVCLHKAPNPGSFSNAISGFNIEPSTSALPNDMSRDTGGNLATIQSGVCLAQRFPGRDPVSEQWYTLLSKWHLGPFCVLGRCVLGTALRQLMARHWFLAFILFLLRPQVSKWEKKFVLASQTTWSPRTELLSESIHLLHIPEPSLFGAADAPGGPCPQETGSSRYLFPCPCCRLPWCGSLCMSLCRMRQTVTQSLWKRLGPTFLSPHYPLDSQRPTEKQLHVFLCPCLPGYLSTWGVRALHLHLFLL